MERRTYTIEVRGCLPDGVAAELGEFELHAGDASTRITGPVIDSAALYGLLARLESLGVALVAVHPDPDGPEVVPTAGARRRRGRGRPRTPWSPSA